MARSVSLLSSRVALDNELNSALALLTALQQNTKRGSGPGVPKSFVDLCVGVAFMGMVAAWEGFLEEALVKFKTGASSGHTPAPVLRSRSATIASARSALLGGRAYLKLTYLAEVRGKSATVFSAHDPFTVLTADDQVKHAARIRNRVAHANDLTRREFNAIARMHRGASAGAPLPQGYNPGRLLVSSPSNAIFGQPIGNSYRPTVFEEYAELYRALAAKVVP